MKFQSVMERALKDPRYAKKLHELGLRARNEGMESRAFLALAKEFASTAEDVLLAKTTLGYTSYLSYTLSNIPKLGADICVPVPHLPGQSGTGYPLPPWEEPDPQGGRKVRPRPAAARNSRVAATKKTGAS